MEFFQEYLNKFSKSGKMIENLSRFRELCRVLGDPHKELRFIHISGTNGKGSISEYLAVSLFSEGFKVGKFTSPFILNINERITLDKQAISNDDFSLVMREVEKAITITQRTDYSQFELLTAAAFLYFKKERVDIVVLETGIGGLLDCTNIITPAVSVIGKVDYDHGEILGFSLSEVASHKAGIIKKNTPVIIYPDNAEVIDILENTAREFNAPFIIPDMNELMIKEISLFGNNFIYKGVDYNTTMGGVHQILNAITAIETLSVLNVSGMSIKQGLNTTVLMARLQVTGNRPIIIFDGSHNVGGIKAAIELISPLPAKKIAVFGMLGNKDYVGALTVLSEVIEEFVLVKDFDSSQADTDDLIKVLAELGYNLNNVFVKSVEEALPFVKDRGDAVLVCGSLYLAGRLI